MDNGLLGITERGYEFLGRDLTCKVIHPASIILVLSYIFGLRLISVSQKEQMWKPRLNDETEVDVSQEVGEGETNLVKLWIQFFICAILIALTGYDIANVGLAIASETGLSESLMGGHSQLYQLLYQS